MIEARPTKQLFRAHLAHFLCTFVSHTMEDFPCDFSVMSRALLMSITFTLIWVIVDVDCWWAYCRSGNWIHIPCIIRYKHSILSDRNSRVSRVVRPWVCHQSMFMFTYLAGLLGLYCLETKSIFWIFAVFTWIFFKLLITIVCEFH